MFSSSQDSPTDIDQDLQADSQVPAPQVQMQQEFIPPPQPQPKPYPTNAQQAQMNRSSNVDLFGAPIQAAQLPVQNKQVPLQQKPRNQLQRQVQQQQQQQQASSSLLGGITNFFSGMFSSDPDYKLQLKTEFNDDDDLQPIQVDNQQQLNYDLAQKLALQVRAQYAMLRTRKDGPQELAGMVSVATQDIEIQENAKEIPTTGIDLICVIDVSGSMQGIKIDMVKQTLKALLDFLNPRDRLCLIVFNSSATRITPLKCVTKTNLKYFNQAINTLNAGGSTTIGSGTELAFQQINQRVSKNKVTSIFLLSDGQDGGAINRLQLQIAKQREIFSIYSFGFGDDHDAAMMSKICELGKGSFYFIKDVKLLDEFFADALGGLLTAVGSNLEIQVRCQPKEPFDKVQFSKVYGDMWNQVEAGKYYTISLPQIASGSKKDYVFELTFPSLAQDILDHQRQQVIVEVILTVTDMRGEKVTKQAQLELQIFNENDLLPPCEADMDVAANYLRVKAADAIDDARRACERNQNEKATRELQALKKKIELDPQLKVAAQQTFLDLEQASQACERKNFSSHGQKQMIQMKTNNYKQAGINSNFDAMGQQIQQVEKAAFQNRAQEYMVKQVQMKKRS